MLRPPAGGSLVPTRLRGNPKRRTCAAYPKQAPGFPRAACNDESEHKNIMNIKMNMIYWKSDKFWLGRLIEHPDIMTQGETIEELEENLKDAFVMMAMDDVPESFQVKEIAV